MDDAPHSPTRRDDVRLPPGTLGALARIARTEDDSTARALREAGRRAGAEIAALLAETVDPAREPMDAFWAAVREELAERGLGDARYGLLGSDLAEVRWTDGPEAASGGDGAGCPFATGLLAGLLSEAAGTAVAVLEVTCGASDEAGCRFLAGDGERLRAVRRGLLAGSDLEEAAGLT